MTQINEKDLALLDELYNGAFSSVMPINTNKHGCHVFKGWVTITSRGFELGHKLEGREPIAYDGKVSYAPYIAELESKVLARTREALTVLY